MVARSTMRKLLNHQTSSAPLAVFRVLFGFIMAVSVLRFALKGWIAEMYINPAFYFTFSGFDWVAPLGPAGMYALFVLMGLSAVGIMLGWHYRPAVMLFFLSFTYVELIDKANYLNHYYFVSIIAFLLIWVPANRRFSLDALRRPEIAAETVPAWTIDIFKLQLGLVYFFAGLAKLHPEWLLEAMPLKLWLPAHADLPIVGAFLTEPAAAYLFSWAGALYDLTIVFFLLWNRTWPAAYAAVVVFHLTTAVLFPIGMFPWIMVLATLVFFPPAFHERVIDLATRLWRGAVKAPRTVTGAAAASSPAAWRPGRRASLALTGLLGVFFTLQILVPLRAFTYSGDLFWSERGYRFSWRVMLMEKAGSTLFHVRDSQSGREWQVAAWEYLTPNQEKMMSTQPDMILQFAHFLEEQYVGQGLADVEVRAESYVTLNGRRSRLMIDPDIDLTQVSRIPGHRYWVLPFDDTTGSWISRQ